MKRIPLTRGLFAIIDDEDFDLVSQYKWWIDSTRGGKYVYAASYINGKATPMHRLIMNPPKTHVVDHINHDGLDNRRGNLRVCTNGQNTTYCRRYRPGFKGVRADTRTKWHVIYRARIRTNGKDIETGSFKTAREAALLYDELAKKHFGEFALTNAAMGLL